MGEQAADLERVRRDQRELWNSAAPGWKAMWSGLDRAAQHVSDRLVELARIKPGDRVLDIACGLGEPGITAARKVGPGGLVVLTDHSPAMLELARQRAAALEIENVAFVETDAETLAVKQPGFNAVICRWGLMFVPDLDAVARRIAELLVAAGSFATSVWGPADKVPMIAIGEDAVRKLAKLKPPPAGAPGPFKLADTTALRRALSGAGFKQIQVEPISVSFQWPSAEAFTEQRRATSAPFRAVLARQSPELQRRILDAVTRAARRFADGSGGVRMNNQAICIAAHL